MKQLILAIMCLAFTWIPAQANAQQFSTGERTEVFACFFECKPGPTVQGTPTWQETTTLLVARPQISNIGATAQVTYLDGNRNILAASTLSVSSLDLDELHVCRTLEAAGIPLPEAGLILASSPSSTLTWWAKNLLGKFFVTQDEPFAGRVSGIAKFECRAVPPETIDFLEVQQAIIDSGAPFIPSVIVEQTSNP